MTVNEQIAKEMGWEIGESFGNKIYIIYPRSLYAPSGKFGVSPVIVNDCDFSEDTMMGLWLAKLLIDKMRDKGFRVNISCDNDGAVAFVTHPDQHDPGIIWGTDEPELPAAIVALFKKVYGIADEN